MASRPWQIVSALLGLSAWRRPAALPGAVDDGTIDRAREYAGGQLSPPAQSQTRWYQADLESAEIRADNGDLSLAASLMASARKDGVLAGVLSTRTSGLVRLPKRFRGPSEIVAALESGHGSVRSVFDEMFPAGELALLAADGELLGVGVGEMVPVDGRDYPVFVRLDPRYLTFRWNENRWYFRSIAGLIPITPGDGQWVLHCPGGRNAPWQNGLWKAVGRAFIRKDHAQLHKDNYEAKLANPARVAVAPAGAPDEHRQSWFRAVMAWGVNTVFGMTPGYDVKLLESNGRGWEAFDRTIEAQNQEMIIAVAGQTVTTDGGAGFSNSDIHRSIRSDLIQATADSLAYTINTQGLPVFIADRFGIDALSEPATVAWDTSPTKDRASDAASMAAAAQAISQLDEALARHGKSIDIDAMMIRFGIPVSTVLTGAQGEVALALPEDGLAVES